MVGNTRMCVCVCVFVFVCRVYGVYIAVTLVRNLRRLGS